MDTLKTLGHHKVLPVKITKWHNSCNIDPSAPFFLHNMQCLMVKVWRKFKQNQAKAIRVIEQNLKNDIFKSKLQSGITLITLTLQLLFSFKTCSA